MKLLIAIILLRVPKFHNLLFSDKNNTHMTAIFLGRKMTTWWHRKICFSVILWWK